MYKQIIIARKDIMTPGKLAAQVSHASMAFLTCMIRNNSKRVVNENIKRSYMYNLHHRYVHPDLDRFAKEATEEGCGHFYYKPKDSTKPSGEMVRCTELTTKEYNVNFTIDKDLYDKWINGEFTKVVLGAKNRNQLLKAKIMAEEIGMIEGKDFFLIRDNCHTELEPEEIDENGVGRTLTCIGFRPMESEIIDKIGRKYHLYI